MLKTWSFSQLFSSVQMSSISMRAHAAGTLVREHTCSHRQFAKFAYLPSRGKTDKKSKASGGKKFQSAVFAYPDRSDSDGFSRSDSHGFSRGGGRGRGRGGRGEGRFSGRGRGRGFTEERDYDGGRGRGGFARGRGTRERGRGGGGFAGGRGRGRASADQFSSREGFPAAEELQDWDAAPAGRFQRRDDIPQYDERQRRGLEPNRFNGAAMSGSGRGGGRGRGRDSRQPLTEPFERLSVRQPYESPYTQRQGLEAQGDFRPAGRQPWGAAQQDRNRDDAGIFNQSRASEAYGRSPSAYGRGGRGPGQRGRGAYGGRGTGDDRWLAGSRGQQGWGQQQQAARPLYERETADPVLAQYREQWKGDALYGVNPVLAAIKAKRRQIYQLYVQEGASSRVASEIQKVTRLAEAQGIAVQTTSKHNLNVLTSDAAHQGLVLDCEPLEFKIMDSFGTPPLPGEPHPLWIALDEVTDPQNLGAILRSVHFLGATGVLTCSRNSAPLTPAVSKASSGALEFLPVHSCHAMQKTLANAAREGWRVMGALSSPEVVPCSQVALDEPTVLVLGSEGKGLRTNVKAACTSFTKISRPHGLPMDDVDSLNVSVAAGIMLHQLVTSSGGNVAQASSEDASAPSRQMTVAVGGAVAAIELAAASGGEMEVAAGDEVVAASEAAAASGGEMLVAAEGGVVAAIPLATASGGEMAVGNGVDEMPTAAETRSASSLEAAETGAGLQNGGEELMGGLGDAVGTTGQAGVGKEAFAGKVGEASGSGPWGDGMGEPGRGWDEF